MSVFQSHRDGMFIVKISIQHFEFRESTPNTLLVFGGNGMCIPQINYKHSVPTELKKDQDNSLL